MLQVGARGIETEIEVLETWNVPWGLQVLWVRISRKNWWHMIAQERVSWGRAVVRWGFLLTCEQWEKNLPLSCTTIIRRFALYKVRHQTDLLHLSAPHSTKWASQYSWLRPSERNIVSECTPSLILWAIPTLLCQDVFMFVEATLLYERTNERTNNSS
jgi:hypothetical protein